MPKILTAEELAKLKDFSPETAAEIRARNLAFAEHELALLLRQQSTIARKIATVEAVIRSQKGAVEPDLGSGPEEKVVAASGDMPPIVMPEAFGTPAFVKRFFTEAIQIVSEAKAPLAIAEVMAKHPHRELFIGETGGRMRTS